VNFSLTVHCAGVSAKSRSSDMTKLKSLSANMHRQELDAARRTFCYRSVDIAERKPSFASCVADAPCYTTVPQVVCSLLIFGGHFQFFVYGCNSFVVCYE
jgi:hypothetical protein